MSFVYKNGVTYSNIADYLEDGTDGLYAALAAMGWTLWSTISATSGATDKVFKSTGEDGSEVIYVRITQTNSTTCLLRIYSYFVQNGGTSDGYNEVGTSTSGWTSFTCADAAFIGWIAGDKDHVAVSRKQDTYYSTFGFGVVKRLSPMQWSGRTSTLNDESIAAAGNTVLEVGSVANFTVGQKVFVVNTGSTAARRGNILRCTVQSIDLINTTLTVSNDAATLTDFDSGALVALDPMPTCIVGSGYSYGGYYHGSPSRGAAFLYNPATTRLTGAAQATPAHNCKSASVMTARQIFAAGYDNLFEWGDPESSGGEWLLNPILFQGHVNSGGSEIAGGGKLRGYIERICFIPPTTTISPEDTLKDGSLEWIMFTDENAKMVELRSIGFKQLAVRTVA